MIRKIIADLKRYYYTSNNERYCKHLRSCGIKLGGGVNFRYPHHTTIDTTRPTLVEIGDNVDINDNFTIMTHDFGTYVFRNLYGDFVPSSGKVKIGNNIYFGRDVTILKGVTIGDNCIIGLGSIVTKDIPANSVVCGSPAKVVCNIKEYYEKRKKLSASEAVEFALSIRERTGREPIITDFKEEWALFLTIDEYEKAPQLKHIIDWRLRCSFSEYRKVHPLVFDGFDDFLSHLPSTGKY